MDENKENLTEETEVEATPDTEAETQEVAAEAAADTENTTITDGESPEDAAEDAKADTEDAEADAEDAEADTEDADSDEDEDDDTEDADNEDDDEDEDDAPAPKKKKTLQFTILVSACIVLAVLAVAIVCRLFFNNGVVNTNLFGGKSTTTWHFRPEIPAGASVDEAQISDFYFIFGADGSIKVERDSIEYQGVYTIRNLEAKDLIGIQNDAAKEGQPVLTIENTGIIDGDFLYVREGNAFSDNYLTLTTLQSDQTSLKFDAKAYAPPTYEREGDFNKDDQLLGSWVYRNEVAEQTFTFNEDGTYLIKTKQNNTIQNQTGIYDTKDGSLTIYFKSPQQQSQTVKYAVSGSKLSLSMVIKYGEMEMEQPLGVYTKVGADGKPVTEPSTAPASTAAAAAKDTTTAAKDTSKTASEAAKSTTAPATEATKK